MPYTPIISLFCLLFLLTQPGDKINVISQDEIMAHPSCNELHWKGSVLLADLPDGRNAYFLDEKMFIENGTAAVNQEFTDHYRFWTNIELEIPCTKKINMDNIKLEWKAKSDISVNFRESDFGAVLTGEKNIAYINALAAYRPPYTIFQYGNTKLTDVPELAINPSGWAVYAIQINNSAMTFSKNGIALKKIKSNEELGSLKKITLHFKGSGKIDWVKLYDTKKIIMKEEFEKEGKSSIEWKK